jgi:phage minor structural protein
MWFILDTKLKPVGVIDNSLPAGLPLVSDSFKERLLNGYDTLEFEVPSNHPKVELLENEGYIIRPDDSGSLSLFRIKEVDESHGVEINLRVFCEPAATSDLMGKRIRPVKHISKTLTQVAEALLSLTDWELGDSFYDGLVTIEFLDYPTALEALHTLIASFNVEIEFKVEFNGTKVLRKIVNLHEKRGTDTKEIIEYGKNLKGLTRNVQSNALYTSMIAVGRDDGNGNKITIADLAITPPDPFIKIGDVVADEDALAKWVDDGIHREGVYKDDNATTAMELYTNTLAELKKYNHPQYTYSVSNEMLNTRADIGDTLRVKDITFNPPLYLDARVLEKESSEIDETKGGIVLGEFILLKTKPIVAMEKIQRKIELREEEWNAAYEKANEIEDNIVYKVEIDSTNGDTFLNGNVDTFLVASVYKGKDNITDTLPAISFEWKKTDKDGIEDIGWNNAVKGAGKSVAITKDDVNSKATFACEVEY